MIFKDKQQLNFHLQNAWFKYVKMYYLLINIS